MLNSRIRLLAGALMGTAMAIASPSDLSLIRNVGSALQPPAHRPPRGKHRQSMAQQKRCATKRRNRLRHKARIQRKKA